MYGDQLIYFGEQLIATRFLLLIFAPGIFNNITKRKVLSLNVTTCK